MTDCLKLRVCSFTLYPCRYRPPIEGERKKNENRERVKMEKGSLKRHKNLHPKETLVRCPIL